MAKITRKAFVRKKIIGGIIAFTAVTLVAVGVSAIVLSQPTYIDSTTSISVSTTSSESVTFEKNKTNAYVTGDTTKTSAPIYRFEPDKNDNEGRVRFTDVSEVLSITVDASINHAERLSQITAMVLTKRVADEDRIKAAVTKGYIELPEAFTFTESETKIYDMIYDTSSDYFHDKEFKELTVGRNLSFSYDIAFKWGSFFEHKNPSIYFDEEGSSIPMGDDNSSAGSNTVRGILKELRALLNGIELNLWLTAK